ncbi:MAG TPA: response regulator transcription factor [Chloroflexota bacterium]|nr:response regulator transcription factor [Chloroflexota bacterium]
MLASAGFDVLEAAEAGADVSVVAGEELLSEATAEKVVLLTNDGRHASLLRSLGLAGWALLPPDASADQLAAAVNAVAQRLALVPVAEAAGALPRPLLELAGELSEQLTPRELEVLQLVSYGLSNKLIARQLNISEHTVKFHVSSTYAKLGAASRTEAVSLAARQGLITL